MPASDKVYAIHQRVDALVTALPELGTEPADGGYAGWSFDPACGTASPGLTLAGAGVLSLIKIPVRFLTTVSNVYIDIITAGATLTLNQCFAGLYTAAGSLIATSANQSVAWVGTGFITMALTGAPFTIGGTAAGGFVWVALLWNGTTAPLLYRGSGPTGALAMQAGTLTAATLRFGTVSAANTTLPASFTPASIVSTNASPWWAGIS